MERSTYVLLRGLRSACAQCAGSAASMAAKRSAAVIVPRLHSGHDLSRQDVLARSARFSVSARPRDTSSATGPSGRVARDNLSPVRAPMPLRRRSPPRRRAPSRAHLRAADGSARSCPNQMATPDGSKLLPPDHIRPGQRFRVRPAPLLRLFRYLQFPGQGPGSKIGLPLQQRSYPRGDRRPSGQKPEGLPFPRKAA